MAELHFILTTDSFFSFLNESLGLNVSENKDFHHNLLACVLPHVYDLTDDHTWLCCFSFSQFIEEQFKVTDHSHRPLPALFHPGWFGHLQTNRSVRQCDQSCISRSVRANGFTSKQRGSYTLQTFAFFRASRVSEASLTLTCPS